jgi:hypothetical protein
LNSAQSPHALFVSGWDNFPSLGFAGKIIMRTSLRTAFTKPYRRRLRRKYGNVETGNKDAVTLALGKHTKETTLSGVLTGNLISGTEIFSGLSFSSTGIYSLIASDGGHLTAKSKGTINVSG